MAGRSRFDPARLRRRLQSLPRRAGGLRLGLVAFLRDRTERPRAWARPVTGPVLEVVTGTAWAALLLAVPALIAGLALGWTELVVAGWLVLALLLVCVAFVLGRHQLSAALDLSRDRVVVGERANGAARLLNRTGHRTLPLSVELVVGQGRARFDLPSLAPRAEHEELFAIPTSRRAVLTVGPVRTVRADPLGLLRREQELTEPELLYVHPRTVRVEGSASGLVRDLEGETVRKLSDNDVAFHALRGYVPGDDRRNIHWKSTARTGTLMVRQFEETRRSHMLVVLSTRLDDYVSEEEFEAAVSIAASLGVRTLSEGHTLTATTSSRVLHTGSTKRLLDQYSGVDYEPAARPLSEVARGVARDHPGASVAVFVCGSLTEAAEIRRARRHLALDLRTIVVRAEPSAETTLRQMGDLDIATVGSLDDLGSTLRRLSR
ncbi:DUF58 domain-containing protein [Nocardioides sp.]|uniref:DUF58 domain-containing protein n=1 Tax=Nocardioides sp. TaxID=35761 RepID=UPI0039E41811